MTHGSNQRTGITAQYGLQKLNRSGLSDALRRQNHSRKHSPTHHCKDRGNLRKLLAAKRIPVEEVMLAVCTEYLHPDHLMYVKQVHLNHPFIADTLAVAFDKAISMHWPCWPNQNFPHPQHVNKEKTLADYDSPKCNGGPRWCIITRLAGPAFLRDATPSTAGQVLPRRSLECAPMQTQNGTRIEQP